MHHRFNYTLKHSVIQCHASNNASKSNANSSYNHIRFWASLTRLHCRYQPQQTVGEKNENICRISLIQNSSESAPVSTSLLGAVRAFRYVSYAKKCRISLCNWTSLRTYELRRLRRVGGAYKEAEKQRKWGDLPFTIKVWHSEAFWCWLQKSYFDIYSFQTVNWARDFSFIMTYLSLHAF